MNKDEIYEELREELDDELGEKLDELMEKTLDTKVLKRLIEYLRAKKMSDTDILDLIIHMIG